MNLKGPSQPMCIARRDTISGHFLCHRNSDVTKEKAYLSADFVYLSNVLKLFSIKCLCKENIAYSTECFVINKLYFCHLRLLLC